MTGAVPSAKGNSLRRNVLALTGLQLANLALPLVTLPYLLRVLGPEQFGAYVLAQAVVTMGIVLADFGFNLSATQAMARVQGNINAVSRLFWSVQTVKVLLGVLAAAALVIVTLAVPNLRENWQVILGSSPGIVAAILFPQWLFQGLERMWLLTACSVLGRVLSIPLVFLAVKSASDAWLAALISATGPLLAGVFACCVIRHFSLVVWVRPMRSDLVQSLRDGWHIFTSTAAISFYTTITPVLLGILTHTAAVGLFSAADRIRQACQSLITPLSNAAYPRISAVMANDKTNGMRMVRKLLIAQGTLTFTISSALWLFAPEIVDLVMGDQYGAAVGVLRILAPLPFLIGLSNVFGVQTMLPLGLKLPFSRIVIGSGLFSILLICAVAPRWEAHGAAVALLLTELGVTLVMAGVLRKFRIRIFVSNDRLVS